MEILSRKRCLLVLVTCMFVSWFDFGIQTTSGAFFDVLLQHYDSDRKTTASVSGLFTAINQGSGIVVGLLINKFGIAKISFIGSFLVPAGFFLSTFATSIVHVLFYFGLLSALGVAMVFVSSAAMIRKVCTGPFKKWLPLSLTIHSSRISLAGFTLPYLVNFFNEMYGLSGTFMLFSGILANNVCISLLFVFVERNLANKCSKERVNDNRQEVKTNADHPSVQNAKKLENRESQHVETYYNEHFKEIERGNMHAVKKDSDVIFVTKFSVEVASKSSSTLCADNTSDGDANAEISTDEKDIRNVMNDCSSQIANRQNEDKMVQNGTIEANDENVAQKSHRGPMSRFKAAVFGHFTSVFVCVFITVAMVLGTQNSYLVVIIDIFESKGFSKEWALNSYLPLNICALICRILPGAVTFIDPILFVAMFAFCGSVGQFVILMSSDYAVCLAGAGLTGVTMGGVISAATIVIAKTIDENKFALAFGQILTGVGLMTTSIAPVYGAMRDAWQSYDIVLKTTSVTQAIGGLLCVVAWILKKKQANVSKSNIVMQ